jgi:hypothetical protein
VTAPDPAWVVVHAEREGQVGEVLGYTAVSPGTSRDVEVAIDPLQATDSLAVMLHTNAGDAGAFEFPGVDAPLQEGGKVVAASFAIERQMRLPEIQVSDQDVLEDGLVRIEQVHTSGPAWVVIHGEADGGIGPVLGFAYVDGGTSRDVVVHLPWRSATPTLYAMLHEDTGQAQRFEFPEEDLPVLVVGEPVVEVFAVTYPPNVVVFDQPVIDNQIVVERVISNGPGWLAVYADEGGSPGFIIGNAPLADGLNEDVTVGLLGSGVTDQLFIFLHEDTEPGNEFDFPVADPQIVYQGRIPNPFSFRTDPGNYLGSRDQALQMEGNEAVVSIPFTVTEVDAWAVVYTDDGGELGEIIGRTWLPAGVNRNVLVTIDPEQATGTLYAVLHWDAGTAQKFEPGGADVPFQRNLRIIQSPFSIIQEP